MVRALGRRRPHGGRDLDHGHTNGRHIEDNVLLDRPAGRHGQLRDPLLTVAQALCAQHDRARGYAHDQEPAIPPGDRTQRRALDQYDRARHAHTGLRVQDAAHDPARRLIVLRSDKVYTTSNMQVPSVEDRIQEPDQIYDALHQFGTRYVVIEDRPSQSRVLEWLPQHPMSAAPLSSL